MRLFRFGQSLFYLVAMLLVFWGISPVLSVSAAEEDVKVDANITVLFTPDITSCRVDPTQISLTDTKYPKRPLNFEYVKNAHSIVIIPKLVKSSDLDFFLLDFQKEYRVIISANALMNGSTPLGETKDFTFKTVKQFSVMTNKDLNLLINRYAPSGITLTIPSKPITYIDISYASVDASKKPLAKPLTNVNISVDSSVAEIRTSFVSNSWVSAKKLTVGTSVVWNAGYSGDMTKLSQDGKTKVGKDIKIRAYDEYDRVIESYSVKLDPKGKKTEDFKSKNRLAGTYNLNNLIVDGGKKFIEILKEFPLDALQVGHIPD